MSGRISSLKRLSRTNCPGKWWSQHPWRCSRKAWTWHLVLQIQWWGDGQRLDLMALKVFSNLKDSVIHGPSFIYRGYLTMWGVIRKLNLWSLDWDISVDTKDVTWPVRGFQLAHSSSKHPTHWCFVITVHVHNVLTLSLTLLQENMWRAATELL